MRKALFLFALLILAGSAGFWLFAGANRGWTKTSVPVKTLDEVTGIEKVDYQQRFVPGVDFLGEAAIGAALLTGAAFLFRKKPTT